MKNKLKPYEKLWNMRIKAKQENKNAIGVHPVQSAERKWRK